LLVRQLTADRWLSSACGAIEDSLKRLKSVDSYPMHQYFADQQYPFHKRHAASALAQLDGSCSPLTASLRLIQKPLFGYLLLAFWEWPLQSSTPFLKVNPFFIQYGCCSCHSQMQD
jgi:hypothetical protein